MFEHLACIPFLLSKIRDIEKVSEKENTTEHPTTCTVKSVTAKKAILLQRRAEDFRYPQITFLKGDCGEGAKRGAESH